MQAVNAMRQKFTKSTMKTIFTAIVLINSIICCGQNSNKTVPKMYVTKFGTDSVILRKMPNGFFIGTASVGHVFRLKENLTFQKIDYSRSGNIIDSGLWIIKNERELVLTSQKHTLAFQLIKYDTYLFFLLPGQKDKFIYDLTQLKKELKNETPVQTENRTLGIEDFIAKRLLEKYYGRDLYFDAGT